MVPYFIATNQITVSSYADKISVNGYIFTDFKQVRGKKTFDIYYS